MFKKRIFPVMLATVVLFTLLAARLKTTTANAATGDWVLKWSDEFNGTNGSGVDTSKWNYEVGGGGFGNNELEYYTNRTQNCYQDGTGNLVIKALKENYNGSQYTSARINTKGKFNFTYGKIEMRAKLPYGQGIWPAFWMLGSNIDTATWPNCGEIDIMELVGKDPTHVYGTIHGPGYSGGSSIGASYYNSAGFSNAFHTYTVEWEQNVIRWYVDGNLYETRTPSDLGGKTWVFDHNMFILLNLAVGGSWPGNPDASTVFPQSYTIDYVRVYQRDAGTPVSSTIALKSVSNNLFVCADNSGSSPLIANRTSASTWEQFQKVDLGNGNIALKSLANNQYVCADNYGNNPLIANRASYSTWETFQVVNNSDGTVSLKALANNLYVSAVNSSTPLIANKSTIGTTEKFYLIAQ